MNSSGFRVTTPCPPSPGEKPRTDMLVLRNSSTHRRAQLGIGLVMVALFYAEYDLSQGSSPVTIHKNAIVWGEQSIDADLFEKLIRTQPLRALVQARDKHRRTVSDYTCNFVKQELLPSGMTDEQEIDVKFRAEPFSVMMHWLRNPGLAERVVYVRNRWIDKGAATSDEREQAVCRPIPPLSSIIKSIKQPIRGGRARDASRRCIAEFGFERSLDLLIQYCQLAEERGELDLKYRGESYFDGRPTWVIQRHLPYTGEDGRYPDRTAEIHIDKEYGVPVAIYCYADDEMKPEHLLGKYEYRNVRLGVGLGESDFDPKTYGM